MPCLLVNWILIYWYLIHEYGHYIMVKNVNANIYNDCNYWSLTKNSYLLNLSYISQVISQSRTTIKLNKYYFLKKKIVILKIYSSHSCMAWVYCQYHQIKLTPFFFPKQIKWLGLSGRDGNAMFDNWQQGQHCHFYFAKRKVRYIMAMAREKAMGGFACNSFLVLLFPIITRSSASPISFVQ